MDEKRIEGLAEGCPCCPPASLFRRSRRRALRAIGGGLAAAAIGGLAAAQSRRPMRPLAAEDGESAGRLPMVDFHTHLQKRVAADGLISRMNSAAVARLVLMPLYYRDGGGAVNDGEGSDEQAAEYARRYPDRFVPFVGMQRPELNGSDVIGKPTDTGRKLLRETEAKLRSGEFFGMGEFMLRFYPYTNRFGIVATLERDYPADGWFMRQCADLSARHKVPMCFHAEAEPHVGAAVLRLVESNPDAIFIWAHNCGRSSAIAIDAMFQRFPNLYADLGGMVYSGVNVEHYGVYWPRRTPYMHLVVDEGGRLVPEMKNVLEKWSDRYVTGTDIAHARVYERYIPHIPRWRYVLSQLSPLAARNIAFATANRLFRLTVAGRQRFPAIDATMTMQG